MNLLEYKIEGLESFLKWQKRFLKKSYLIGFIYPALMSWFSVQIYYNPNVINGFGFGVNLVSGIFYLIGLLDSLSDYKKDRELLNFYKKSLLENKGTRVYEIRN